MNFEAATAATAATARIRYLERLAEASNAISATLDLDKVAEVLVARTVELLEAPGVSVILLDDQNGAPHIKVAAYHGVSANYAQTLTGPLDQTIAGRALVEQRIFAAWDMRDVPNQDAARAAEEEGIHAVACAPMFFAGRPVGALNLYCREPRCFSPDQFHVLSLLAAQGAVALTNARAYRELQTRADEVREGYRRVGAALSASFELSDTLRLIVQLSVEMTRAAGGALFLFADGPDQATLSLSASRGLDRRSALRFRRQSASGVAQKALSDKKPVVVADTRRRTDTAFPLLRENGDEGAEAETRSVVCVPVYAGGRALGVLEQYAPEPGRFTRADQQVLSGFAVQAAVAIENARLYAQERNVAKTLQTSFLPQLPQSVSGFEIGRIYAPGNKIAHVGGDTYDLFTLPDKRIVAVMADISGQGTHAATIAVMVKYTVRAYAFEDASPSRILARVNEAIMRQTDDATFATICIAVIDPDARHVRIASAAHPPALLYRAETGECEPLCAQPGLIAGFLPDQEYTEECAALAPGDILTFYTDGVTEARRRKVMFDNDRLKQAIIASAHESAQEIASNVYAAVSDYTSHNLDDDVALLTLKAE